MRISTRKPRGPRAAARRISAPASAAAGLASLVVALAGASLSSGGSGAATSTPTASTAPAASAHAGLSAQFLQRANKICSDVIAKGESNNGRLFPYSDFDPMHPKASTLPLVGRYFEPPTRGWKDIRMHFDALRTPTMGAISWEHVVTLVNAAAANQAAQDRAALGSNATQFVKTVRRVQQLGPELQTALAAASFSSTSSCVTFLTH